MKGVAVDGRRAPMYSSVSDRLALHLQVPSPQHPQPHPLEGIYMTTLAVLENHYGITHHDYLDKEAEVPTVSRLAMQGDVAIIRDEIRSSATPIPATGYPVVKGENGGNTHAVFGPGFFTPMTATVTNLDLGVLTVPVDVEVLLSHPEHGGLLIGPGSYVLRRQREQGEIARLVAD